MSHTHPTSERPLATSSLQPRKSTQTSSAPPLVPSKPVNAAQKVPRRSSKPIINWFQRKLAGTVRTKRVENLPLNHSDLGRGPNRNGSRTVGRIASSPLPSAINKAQAKQTDGAAITRRKTLSFNGNESLHDDNNSMDQSLFRDTISSPASALEADDDASVRPIPPSAPPSPSPSRSSSSYLSDPRTFRSMAASTKPTTLLSIDLNGNGMAHIAQAPLGTPTSQIHPRFAPHVRQSSSLSNPNLLSSGGSITFSSLPQGNSRPSSLRDPSAIQLLNIGHAIGHGPVSPIQAPLHTTHHPRNNPRPSSPPLDNASVLTLASSAYAQPTRTGTLSYGSTHGGGGDSVSHFGGSTYADMESTSQFLLGDDDRLDERDVDASVRALRPRSSRRGSWESEASRWSARVQHGGGSLARERSVWTTNSARTGGLSHENGEVYVYARSDELQNEDYGVIDDSATQETSNLNSWQADSVEGDTAEEKSTSNEETDTSKDNLQHHESSELSSGSSIPRTLSTETVAQSVAVPAHVGTREIGEASSDLVSRSADATMNPSDLKT